MIKMNSKREDEERREEKRNSENYWHNDTIEIEERRKHIEVITLTLEWYFDMLWRTVRYRDQGSQFIIIL
jgi:hypothetical protein